MAANVPASLAFERVAAIRGFAALTDLIEIDGMPGGMDCFEVQPIVPLRLCNGPASEALTIPIARSFGCQSYGDVIGICTTQPTGYFSRILNERR